jgi:hypothetical protein
LQAFQEHRYNLFSLILNRMTPISSSFPPASAHPATTGTPPDIIAPVVHVLGIPFHAMRLNLALDKLEQFIRQRTPRHICLSNAYTVALAKTDPELRSLLIRADLVLPDGMSIVWGSLLAEYLATLPPDQTQLFVGENGRVPSFTWWHNNWAEVRRRAGLKDVQQRDLRRSCATDLTEYLDLVSISKGILNHRDLNTTQIYVQPVNKRIVEAMDEHVLKTRSHLPATDHSRVQQPVPAKLDTHRGSIS